MEGPDPKKRKIHRPPPRRTAPSPASTASRDANSTSSLRVPGVQTTDIASFRVQQDKNFAVAQAQQDGSTGNYKKFDSWYGNFLVPVVPSRTELNG
ncbi:Hexokinase 1 isoform 1 [Hibiscus syriacus]|uniref:Hexokinase 1 isoform 1 n=1 Tax=Hibiscus syriacus TaxID=106335 RepID=A0A6A3D7M2_HIBSY|nr:Hexokinase 1 isoform 1 [Hibiscus syriacus]